MRISDLSSGVCSSDHGAFTCVEAVKRVLGVHGWLIWTPYQLYLRLEKDEMGSIFNPPKPKAPPPPPPPPKADDPVIEDARKRERRSEEHTSELQSLMRNSYAVFCLKKKNNQNPKTAQKLNTYQY